MKEEISSPKCILNFKFYYGYRTLFERSPIKNWVLAWSGKHFRVLRTWVSGFGFFCRYRNRARLVW
jgi:hypothetical protein